MQPPTFSCTSVSVTLAFCCFTSFSPSGVVVPCTFTFVELEYVIVTFRVAESYPSNKLQADSAGSRGLLRVTIDR